MSAWLIRLHASDERILHALVMRRRRVPVVLMHGITHLGDAATTVGFTILLLVAPEPAIFESGRVAAIALVASHLGVQLLKRTINRARPRLPVGYDSLVRAPDRFSFPSGHAAASLSIGLALLAVLPAMADLIAVFIALLVGVSRCYLGVHYPGDVVSGWLLAVGGVVLAGVIL